MCNPLAFIVNDRYNFLVSQRGNTLGFVLLGLLVACGAFVYVQRGTISAMYELRQPPFNDPALRELPRPLPELKVNDANGTTITGYGYAFEAPWKDTPKSDHSHESFMLRFTFVSTRLVCLLNRGMSPDFAALIRSDPRSGIGRVLGPESVSSKYALESAAMNAFPRPINLFTPSSTSIRQVFLLTWKSLAPRPWNVDTTVFNISSPSVRGFQFGDPAKTTFVILHLYDSADRMAEIWVSVDPKSQDRITQADINRIIQTVHFTDSH